MTPTTIEAQKVAETPPSNGLVKSMPSASDAMISVIERAIMSPDFDVAKLQHLLELRERYEASEARKAFVSAMAEFKANPPTILKNKKVGFGSGDKATSYSHATLDHVVDAVTKGLSQHGISHRWKVEQVEHWIKVTCILTHSMGHSEETMLQGVADTTGSKNSIQAIGSTVTYLQRYTLLAATGLAAANSDTDGKTAPTSTALDAGKVLEKCEWIANCRNMDELKKIYGDAYTVALKAKDRAAQQRLIDAYEARKKELQ